MIFQYDASQEKCPLPLVNLRLILKKMKKEDVCMIKISDSGSRKNIPQLLSKLSYFFTQNTINNSVVEITLSKSELTPPT